MEVLLGMDGMSEYERRREEARCRRARLKKFREEYKSHRSELQKRVGIENYLYYMGLIYWDHEMMAQFYNDPRFWKMNKEETIRLLDDLKDRYVIDYHTYLDSPEWKERSALAKARAGYRCQVCDSPDRLETHHRTYERIGREDDGDLVVLCHRCHSLFEDNGGLKHERHRNEKRTVRRQGRTPLERPHG